MDFLSIFIKKLRNSRKKGIAVGLLVVLVLSFTVAVFLNLPEKVEAAWWDDSFGYRHRVSFTHNADLSTSQAVTFTLDTAELIAASLMQADCDDTRFTTINGEPLSYDLTGTCDNATTTYEVIFPTIYNGSNVFFVYYGSPSAANNEIDSTGITALTPSGGDPSLTNPTSSGNQEKTTGPVAYWKFDEGYGTTTYDSSFNNNASISGATWQPEDLCISGKCLFFDGSNDVVTVSNTVSGIQTVAFWVKLQSTSTTQEIIDLNATDYLTSVSGALTAASFGTETIYIDGKTGTALTANKWHFVTVTTSSGLTGSAIKIGQISTNYGQAFFDEVKIYNYARSAAQIKADFQRSAGMEGSSVVLGSNTSNLKSLSDGLVGYFKMDESSWNGTSGEGIDSSGNGNHGTAYTGTTTVTGKFGSAGDFDGAYENLNIPATLINETNPTFTYSLWVKADNNAAEWQDILAQARGGTNNNASYELSYSGSSFNITISDGVGNRINAYSYNLSSWTHVSVVNDYAGNKYSLYINGQQVFTNSTPAGTPSQSLGAQFKIGTHMYDPYNRDFYGQVDEARVYNRALTGQEVSQLYNWAPGPVGYWKMDEKTGTTTADSSGNANTGTLTNGATWGRGKFGSAAKLDGDNDIVRISDPGGSWEFADGGLDAGTSDFTIGSWAYLATPLNNTHASIITKGGSSTTIPGYAISIINGNLPRLYISSATNNAVLQFNTISISNAWHYISIVVDREPSLDTAHFYLDGVFIQTLTSATVAGQSLSGTSSVDIGDRHGDSASNWTGSIDEVKIYNYTRTAKQVIEDMNGGHPAGGSPVGSQVAYWKLDEGYGTTANDSTPNGNLLTLSTSTSAWTNSGKFGKAWDGNGTRYLSRADDADFDFTATEDFSVSLWYKSDSATNPAATEYLINKANATTAGWAVYANTSGNLCFAIDDDTSWTPDIASCTSTDVYDATWHHVLGIRNTALDTTAIFVDGKQRDSDSDTTTATLANGLSLYVGDRDGTDNGDEFAGDLDEIKVYRSALSADEIKIDYNRNQSQVLGALGNNSNYASDAANQIYCVFGDTTSCAAPVAEWKFEEGQGNTVNDTSGNSYTGTWSASGDHWASGKFGKGSKFNGDDIRIDVGNEFNTSSMTWSAWIKSDTFSSSNGFSRRILSQSSGTGATDNEIQLVVNTSSKAVWYGYDNAYLWNLTGNTTLAVDQWYHITGTIDGSSARLYVNGILDASSSYTGSIATTSNLDIGDHSSVTGASFDGVIDQIRIYNYSRTPAQIAWDYNQGAPVAHWKLDECQGSTANDSSGNGFAGTITPGDTSGDNDTVGSCGSGVTTEMWNDGTTGKYNGSLGFDGTNDYVSFSAWPSVKQANFSVSAWYKKSSGNRIRVGGQQFCGNMQFMLNLENTSVSFLVPNQAGTCNEGATSATVSSGVWNHVVGTFDGTNTRLFINGELKSTDSTWSGTFNTSPTEPFVFGRYDCSVGCTYGNGQLDGVQVYNYALSQTQIKQIYNQGSAVRFGPAEGSP